MQFIWYGIAALIAFYAFGYGNRILQLMSTKFRLVDYHDCSPEDFPASFEAMYAETIAELSALGFVESGRQYTTGVINLEYWTYVLHHPGERAYAFINLAIPPVPGHIARVIFYTFLPQKPDADSPYLMIHTVNGEAHQIIGDIPDAVVTDALTPSLPALWERHQQVVAEQAAQSPYGPVFISDLPETLNQRFERYFEHLTEKNELRQLDQADEYRLTFRGAMRHLRKNQRGIEASKPLLAAYQQAAVDEEGPVLSPEVEASLYHNFRRIERDALSLTQKVAIFTGTLVLSLVAFSFLFDTQTLSIVLLVLLIHELGHYLAMRLTGHQNLSIFFIPLLGAAAQGTKSNASLGEKITVLLAGPMPGIFLAYLLLHYIRGSYVAWGLIPPAALSSLILNTAIFLFVINLLNLLPLFPLDGGRVINLVFFGLHPWIDTLLKVVAALAFGYGIWRFQDPILLMLTVVVLWLIPQNFRQARALYALRRHLPPSDEPPSNRIAELYSALNEAGFAQVPYGQRTSYVNSVVENWSAFHSTAAARFLAFVVYLVSLGVAIFLIYDGYF